MIGKNFELQFYLDACVTFNLNGNAFDESCHIRDVWMWFEVQLSLHIEIQILFFSFLFYFSLNFLIRLVKELIVMYTKLKTL